MILEFHTFKEFRTHKVTAIYAHDDKIYWCAREIFKAMRPFLATNLKEGENRFTDSVYRKILKQIPKKPLKRVKDVDPRGYSCKNSYVLTYFQVMSFVKKLLYRESRRKENDVNIASIIKFREWFQKLYEGEIKFRVSGHRKYLFPYHLSMGSHFVKIPVICENETNNDNTYYTLSQIYTKNRLKFWRLAVEHEYDVSNFMCNNK